MCVEEVADEPWAGGYTPMPGYRGHADATASVLRDGRLHTGDIGSLEANGCSRCAGAAAPSSSAAARTSIRPRSSGSSSRSAASPPTAVFGIPDERLGERVAAAVEPRAGAAVTDTAVLDACRAQFASYKVTEFVAIVETLPRNAMGKLERTRLAALVADGSADD